MADNTNDNDHIDLDAPVDVADKPREPSPYERKLRAENANYRTRAKQAQEAADQAVKKANEDAEKRVADANTAAEQRVIRAELKASALSAGMVDLDGIKLLDLSKVSMDENGNVTGAEALFAAAAKEKPWLFNKGSANTGSTQPAPKPTLVVEKKATEMSAAERSAVRAKLSRM